MSTGFSERADTGPAVGRLEVPFARPDITQQEIDAAVATMRGGWLTTGSVAQAFEREFVESLGGSGLHAAAVNSATAGLHLALDALGLGPGDEVIVPTWTFTATAEVVHYVGARPVLVDVEEDTLNIDLEKAAAAITRRTKAVIPVHFAGLPVGRTRLREFAAEYGLAVVEDAAHAYPVRDEGILVGAGGSDATVFSFYATKTITTGEGGMLVTPFATLARQARAMRLHGIDRNVFDRYTAMRSSWRYDVVAPGFKYNLTDLAASIGRAQLSRATQMRRRRTAVARWYLQELAGLPLELPAAPPEDDAHAWHLFVVRLAERSGLDREAVIAGLADRGVATSVHFIPLHTMSYWSSALDHPRCPVADRVWPRALSLPLFSAMTDAQVEHVVASLREVVR